MDERLKAFLEKKQQEVNELNEEEKANLLLELDLFDKEYSPTGEFSEEYRYSEDDSDTGKTKWYKKVPIAISDEEYEALKNCLQTQLEQKQDNKVAMLLKFLAVVVYIGGFISPFFFLSGLPDTAAVVATIAGSWVAGFFAGSLLLGFAEVIKLLNDIKNK